MDINISIMIKDMVREKRRIDPDLSPGMAFREVIEENPEWLEKIDIETQSFLLDPELRASLLSKLIELKLKEKKDLTYSMAFSEVQKENRGLTLLFVSDMRKKR
jgi:hypothetical protein